MRFSLRTIACSIAAASALNAMADSIPAPQMSLDQLTAEEIKEAQLKATHKIIFAGDGPTASRDSIEKAIELFYVDQFRQFQDPLAPYFMLMSRDGKLALGIGGAVRMRGWADFGGSVPVNGFVPYMIPVPKDPDQRRGLGCTPGGTALFLQVVGRNPVLGDIIGYVQTDFSGTDNVQLKLKKAYVTVKDFTVGWAPTTFSDVQAEAPTIDGAGQNGKTSHTTLLVRYMRNLKKGWTVAGSVEFPSSHIDADGVKTKKLKDYVPDFAAFAQYGWGHGDHIRLSGIVRTFAYRDLVTMKQHTSMGWGAQLSGIVHPINRLSLYFIANCGKGYQSYMGDMAIGSYDMVSDLSTPGKLYAPLAVGLNFGAKYNFRPNLYATMALGRVGYYPKDRVDPTDYRYGLYGSACLFWEMTPRLQTGIEYLTGSRHNVNGEHASANRIDVLFQFSF